MLLLAKVRNVFVITLPFLARTLLLFLLILLQTKPPYKKLKFSAITKLLTLRNLRVYRSLRPRNERNCFYNVLISTFACANTVL